MTSLSGSRSNWDKGDSGTFQKLENGGKKNLLHVSALETSQGGQSEQTFAWLLGFFLHQWGGQRMAELCLCPLLSVSLFAVMSIELCSFHKSRGRWKRVRAAPYVKGLRFPRTQGALILALAPSCPACSESSLAWLTLRCDKSVANLSTQIAYLS